VFKQSDYSFEAAFGGKLMFNEPPTYLYTSEVDQRLNATGNKDMIAFNLNDR
jgi:hypothetical protein